MGLIGDIKELKGEWKKASKLQKAGIILILFLTTNSVVSLSDVVFRWKGFILDAIEFYRHWVNEPIMKLASALGLSYTGQSVDLIVLGSVVIGSMSRHTSYISASPSRLFFKNPWVKTRGEQIMIGIANFLVYMVILLIVLRGEDRFPDWRHSLIFIGVLIMLSISALQNATTKKASPKKELTLIWGPIIFALVIVGILGAINAGLTRTA